MIHPFADGNGRTGRLATAKLLERFGFSFDAQRPSKRETRRYIDALDFAHRHNPNNRHKTADPRKARYYLAPLYRWLDGRVQEQIAAADLFETPP